MLDSTNHGQKYILKEDLKTNLQNQQLWDKYYPILVEEKRKVTELTWKNTVLIEAEKKGIDLKIYRDDDTEIIYLQKNDSVTIEEETDPYSVGLCTSR